MFLKIFRKRHIFLFINLLFFASLSAQAQTNEIDLTRSELNPSSCDQGRGQAVGHLRTEWCKCKDTLYRPMDLSNPCYLNFKSQKLQSDTVVAKIDPRTPTLRGNESSEKAANSLPNQLKLIEIKRLEEQTKLEDQRIAAPVSLPEQKDSESKIVPEKNSRASVSDSVSRLVTEPDQTESDFEPAQKEGILTKPVFTQDQIDELFVNPENLTFNVIWDRGIDRLSPTRDRIKGGPRSQMIMNLSQKRLFAIAFGDLCQIDRSYLNQEAAKRLPKNSYFEVQIYFQRRESRMEYFGGPSMDEAEALKIFSDFMKGQALYEPETEAHKKFRSETFSNLDSSARASANEANSQYKRRLIKYATKHNGLSRWQAEQAAEEWMKTKTDQDEKARAKKDEDQRGVQGEATLQLASEDALLPSMYPIYWVKLNVRNERDEIVSSRVILPRTYAPYGTTRKLVTTEDILRAILAF